VPYPAAVRLPEVSPSAYRRVTIAALWSLVFIVVTGAAVRLSGSGLGCTDWPTCKASRVVAPFEYHAMVEFVNRTITGLVSVAVMLAVLGSLRRHPRRRDLTWLSLGLVAGVVGQIVLGGMVVKFHLNPWLVQGHFVLSMLLVLDAVVLTHRAGRSDDELTSRARVEPSDLRAGTALVCLAAIVILTGTVTTGTGPHSGQSEGKFVPRLPFSAHDAARVHGVAMMVFLAVTVLLVVRLRRSAADAGLQHAVRTLLIVLVLQGAIGYTQYFTGVPPLLVGLHVFGASLVWLAVLHLRLEMRAPAVRPAELPHVDRVGDHATGRDLVAHG
jgi:cytochrome c oxidase assembly protein subunit 15